MNFGSITSLFLSLFANRDKLAGILTDALALWNKIQTTLPGLATQLQNLADQKTPTEEHSITWLQNSLNTLTNANLPVDGKYGQATTDAIKKFQQEHGLTVDGWAGVQTQAAILQALQSK
jgi:peptidoglycan hydrolase-like protein with peptidoglycan-binding domain